MANKIKKVTMVLQIVFDDPVLGDFAVAESIRPHVYNDDPAAKAYLKRFSINDFDMNQVSAGTPYRDDDYGISGQKIPGGAAMNQILAAVKAEVKAQYDANQ